MRFWLESNQKTDSHFLHITNYQPHYLERLYSYLNQTASYRRLKRF